ncbi:MAG TPA: VOC family protein [Alphaproteobacteria bacterium]|nr:VOC family protein [Alphaproteobacteria bacterium]
MEKITPCLWCNDNAEEMVNFYKSIFPETEVLDVSHNDGKVLVMIFRLNGQEIMALNGGPIFPHSEAFSFYVACDTQERIDHYWNRLIADGGSPSRCGWLKDKFGLSWQIVPSMMGELLKNPRAMPVMFTMAKLDIAALRAA